MLISIETPVFKGTHLRRCIDSVLCQSSSGWRFTLLWDGGSEESRAILEELEAEGHPSVRVHYAENRGIARARRFLTEHSKGELILPLDDDDALPFHAVERLLEVAEERPWSAVIRARREIIDETGKVLDTPPWFPFEPRHYQDGMVTDVFNHSQPYLIRRSAYDRTSGWEGFEDFGYAGEDCDIYLKLEEAGTIELLDEPLYYYRVHDDRASLVLTDKAAYEMWRRLADKTIERIGLPLRRINEKQPFEYERLRRQQPTLADVDFIVVAGAGASSPGSDGLATKGLKSLGVTEDAVHPVVRSGSRHINEGIGRSTRPFICLLDGSVDVAAGPGLERTLSLMHSRDLDLASPKLVDSDGLLIAAKPWYSEECVPVMVGEGQPDDGQFDQDWRAPWLPEHVLLMRREVPAAVGGVDEGYAFGRTAVIDLCLRARQRELACGFLGSVELAISSAPKRTESPEDLRRFVRKWVVYPDLLDPTV